MLLAESGFGTSLRTSFRLKEIKYNNAMSSLVVDYSYLTSMIFIPIDHFVKSSDPLRVISSSTTSNPSVVGDCFLFLFNSNHACSARVTSYSVNWDLVAHWLSRWLSTVGSWVRLPLQPPRRGLGQVLYLQLPVRFGVKLRYSIRVVVGSASE